MNTKTKIRSKKTNKMEIKH